MKLTHLTDKTLLLEMTSLAQKERALLAQVLWYLKEIDRRKLYSDQKCGSLYEFCVKILKYSEGQASRRVSACRLLRDLPEIDEDIKSGDMNLTKLNQANGFFKEMGITEPEKKRKILDEMKGKTIRESEDILAGKRDKKIPPKVSISLKRETVDTLYKIRGMKAHCYQDLDSLIMKMIELTSMEWDRTVVHKRREPGMGNTRYVQVGVKANVWKRDQGKCTNCGSMYALELDHIKPFSLGGKTTETNLRILCRNCNQRKGFEVFGVKMARLQR